MYGIAYAQYDFTKHLNFKTSFGGDFQNTDIRRWQGPLAHRNGADNTQLREQGINRIHLVNDNFFSFDKNGRP